MYAPFLSQTIINSQWECKKYSAHRVLYSAVPGVGMVRSRATQRKSPSWSLRTSNCTPWKKKSLKFIRRFRWAQNLARQSLFDCLLRTPKESLLLQLTCYPVTSCGGCLESRGAKKSEERERGEARKYHDPLPFLFVVCWFSPLLQCFLVFAFSPRELQPFLRKKLTVQPISLFCAATFREMCYDLTESRSLCWVGELVIWPSGTFATSQLAN